MESAPSTASSSSKAISSDQRISSSPRDLVPQFEKPAGPKRGGSLRVPHPNAGKGLIRINKDGTYQYKTSSLPKSQSGSVRVGQMTPPKVSGGSSSAGNLTYETVYGNKNILAVSFDYEWQAFRSFGRLGVNLGSGFATAQGKGSFKSTRSVNGVNVTEAKETYNLYMVPLSAFLTYRFEYTKRQWVVPFINAGATYYTLFEARDDGKSPNIAGAAAVGGGGGLHFSISALDSANAFILNQEYGISDLYFTLEARVMQGLSQEIDFSTQTINGGITVDF